MLSYTKLSGNARHFKTLMGMSLQEFDLLFAKVEKAHPEAERERLSKRPRRRVVGAGRRFALDLRNRVLLLLFYYRTYAAQDVAAEVFGAGQATISRSIDQIAPVVRQCIQIPAKIHDRTKRVSTLEELEEILPRLRCLIDASEQQVQRPKRKDMEKSHYSGKAGRHTAKVQYTVNTSGLIVHNTRHSPGRAHDVRAYRMKHPTLPSGLPSRDGSDCKKWKTRVRVYTDRGYPGAQKMYEEVEVLEPIRRKPGKKLPDVEKTFNRLHSKIRVYVEHSIHMVKTWQIMGGVYRNPLKRYDRINYIVCGLVSQRLLWLAEQAA